MPSLQAARISNSAYCPSYLPVAIFGGGTAGVGHAMAEAFARYTKGRAHIIIIGQNEAAANTLLASFPKPVGEDASGWRHEFVKCDVSLMANLRKMCRDLCSRLERINILVLSAGANTLGSAGETGEGLDWHLSLRYFSRFVYIQELAPLLNKAAELGQDARVMSVLGAGFGLSFPTEDFSNAQARRSTYKWLKGVGVSLAAVRAASISSPYNDAMVAWFAIKYPSVAFTHIHPGMVTTPGFNSGVGLGWLLAPLGWLLHLLIRILLAVSPVRQDCAEWMLYALLDPAHPRGMFLTSRHGDIVSSRVFNTGDVLGESDKKGFLNGTRMKGFGGTDIAVRVVCEVTEELTKEK